LLSDAERAAPGTKVGQFGKPIRFHFVDQGEMMNQERMQILEMVETGRISTEEALQLLEALEKAPPSGEAGAAEEQKARPADVPNTGDWWLYPTIAGAVVMGVGAPLLALGFTGKAAIVWSILCGWIPFSIGLAILTIGVWSRNARWLYLHITNTRSGTRSFSIGLPLPLTLAARVLRMLRPYVPQLKGTGVDEAILALRDGLSEEEADQPFYIDVHDDDGGERVQIYIG
jgi:hypothetical protein